MWYNIHFPLKDLNDSDDINSWTRYNGIGRCSTTNPNIWRVTFDNQEFTILKKYINIISPVKIIWYNIHFPLKDLNDSNDINSWTRYNGIGRCSTTNPNIWRVKYDNQEFTILEKYINIISQVKNNIN